MRIEKEHLDLGDRIRCENWRDLLNTSLELSSLDYGVAVLGFTDMQYNVLTITALPRTRGGDKK